MIIPALAGSEGAIVNRKIEITGTSSDFPFRSFAGEVTQVAIYSK